MLNAFGRGTGDLSQFGDEFFKVIQLSAGMPGSIYSQKLGALSASASLGQFSPEEMGGLAIGATRGGGSSATNMQYLAQLMQFLMHPVSKEAQSTLASIGLGPSQRNRLGGYQTLKTFLTEVNRRGGVAMTGSLANAGDEFLNQATDMGLGAKDVGLSGGGTDLISKAFGRIQSQRMAAILSKLVDPSQVAGTENKTLDQYIQEVTDSAGSADKAMGRAMDYRRIVQATNAMHNFGVEVGTAISPLLQLPASGVTSFSSEFNEMNPWAQRGILAGGATGAALLALRLRNGAGGAGRLVRGGGIAMAGMDALSGGQTRGDSPLNPLYVAVVYQLSGGRGSVPFTGIPGRDMRTVEGELAGHAGTAAGATAAAKSSAFRRVALKTISKVAVPAVALDVYYGGDWDRIKRDSLVVHAWDALFGGNSNSNNQSAIESRINSGTNKRLGQSMFGGNGGLPKLYGQAEITIKDDRTGKVHSVTTDLFPKFTKPAPQTKAKPKTSRSSS
jgi:hypothetical protein